MRSKLIILASVIVLIGIGVFGYFYFFGGSAEIAVAPEGPSGLPLAEQGALPSDTPFGTQEAAETVSARLVKISEGPIVPGFAVTTKTVGTSSPETLVSYIERASGNVFVYSAGAKTITRTSNRTLPGIQSAQWLPDGSAAAVHYLSGENASTINTFVLQADGGEGSFLPQDLSGVAVSSATILSLASAGNGSIISTYRPNGSLLSELFSTPLSSLHASFLGRTAYLLVTKPSATLPGYAFSATARGELSILAGPLFGLSALPSPSGDWVLVSHTLDGVMQTALVDAASRESISLPVGTIADKCVWAPDSRSLFCGVPVNPPQATYPDDWYQGVAHFTDRIWKIDVAGRYAQLVLDFTEETSAQLDAEALTLHPSGTILVFLNRNDGSLWSYAL